MARIRTIKPSFFKSYKLYKSEIDENLPLRIAFAGIWTVADKEGRFKWIPEELKVECLPYDEVDFSRVLDALLTRGYLVKYVNPDGDFFGVIPTWKEHQHINNKEPESILPNPDECSICTREPRVDDAKPKTERGKEGKGRERKGKEGERNNKNFLPFSEIMELYNSICSKLPKVNELTESRKNKIKSRWDSIKNLEKITELFTKTNNTPFLTGDNERGWKASFDWLFENDKNYLSVLEGKYDNRITKGAAANRGSDYEYKPNKQ